MHHISPPPTFLHGANRDKYSFLSSSQNKIQNVCVWVRDGIDWTDILLLFFAGDCDLEWCDGLGMLIILISLVCLGLAYYYIIKKFFGKWIYKSIMEPTSEKWGTLMTKRWTELMLKRLCSTYNCKADISGYAFLHHAEYWTAWALGSSVGINICVMWQCRDVEASLNINLEDLHSRKN